MKDREYILLQNMLRTNKEFLRAEKIEFSEYLENHRIIMAKIKSSIVKIDDYEFNMINISISDQNINDFKNGILILKQNFN